MMSSRFLKIVFIFLFCALAHTSLYAQADASTAGGRPSASADDLPEGFREGLAKRRIKAEEEEHKDLLERGEEAVKISDELSKNYETRQNLTAEDTKKIERLEKVIKKIRQDLGAKDESGEEEEKIDAPSSLKNVLNNIKQTTTGLLSELKKTTRHSISVVAIQSSNSLLKLVRFAKFNKN